MRIQNRHRSGRELNRASLLRLIVLAGCFLLGVLLGQVLVKRIPESIAEELSRYLSDYLTVSETAGRSAKTLLSALMIYFRYPALAFLLGFASVGLVLLPLLSVAYGFFLSFSVCCFTAAFGTSGILLTLSVFGIRCLVTLPCYFFLAVPSLETSAALAAASFGRGKRAAPVTYGSAWWLRSCAVALILLTGSLTEFLFVPVLVRLVLARVLS